MGMRVYSPLKIPQSWKAAATKYCPYSGMRSDGLLIIAGLLIYALLWALILRH
jgi:hypothetical protein